MTRKKGGRQICFLVVCMMVVGIAGCFGVGLMKRGGSAMEQSREGQQDTFGSRMSQKTTMALEQIKAPKQTKALEQTKVREQTKAPKQTKALEQTKTPEQTKAPEQTETPAEKLSLRKKYASKKAGTVVKTAGSTKKEQRAMFYKSKLTQKVFRRMKGKSYKKGCIVPKEGLRYLRMLYVGFDGKAHIGEMVVNKKIADDVLTIFYKLYQKKYPIQRMVLVDEYNADDDKSMAANNTSSFNYRPVKGTTHLSKHSYGLAIDVNPLYNPYIHTMNGRVVCEPKGSKKYSDRSKDFPYKITKTDICFKLFTKYGFSWGGDWNTKKDYQHFQKS